MQVYVGADHRGYQLKNVLYKWLRGRGFDAVDMGPHEANPDDDYPDFALAVAEGVAGHEGSRGLLICGSGVGMDIVANKVRGVRATVGYSAEEVAHGRARDDINVLALPAGLAPDDAESLLELFLMTPFGAAERDVRRQRKISEIEAKHFK